MEDRKLTEKESLELISQMLRETRENIQNYVAYPFLIWGYLTVIVSVIVWYVWSETGNPQWNGLWFALPAIGWPLNKMIGGKADKGTTTYMDRVIENIWIVIGVVVLMVGAASCLLEDVLFIIALLLSIGATLTGWVIKFKPMGWAGAASVLLSFGLLFVPGINQLLVFAILFVIMMIIPGHIFYNHVMRCSKI